MTARNLSCAEYIKVLAMLLSDSYQQAVTGSLARGLRKKPVSPSTSVIIHQQHFRADNQGIKAGQEKFCP